MFLKMLRIKKFLYRFLPLLAVWLIVQRCYNILLFIIVGTYQLLQLSVHIYKLLTLILYSIL